MSLHLEALEGRLTPSVSVVPQQFTTNQYTALSIGQGDLLAGDSGSGTLTVSNPTQSADASLVDNHNGTYTFTPDPGFTGSATFQYDVHGSRLKLTPSDGAQGNNHVGSVAIDGDTAVVWAISQGAAYVFVRTGTAWTQQARLTVPNVAPDFFEPVAISGDTAIIGSEGGARYVFVRSGSSWTQQAKLTVPNAYGPVAVNGDTAVALAGTNVGQSFINGGAYVFVRTGGTWTQQAKLTNPDEPDDPGAGPQPFANVGLSGDTVALTGATFNGHGAVVYVFTRSANTWSQQARLNPYGTYNNRPGFPVSVSGDTLVVGIPLRTVNGNQEQGAADVFVRSGGTWSQQAELTASDGAAFDELGSFVSVSGDTAVITPSPSNTTGLGPVYVFRRFGGTWTQQPEFTSVPLGALSVSGDTAILGSGLRVNEEDGASALDLSSARATATVVVTPATAALTVTPASLPAATLDTGYRSSFTATGGAGSGYTFRIAGVLPAGLTFDTATAQLAGTPAQVGTFPGIIVAASDGQGGSGSQTYTLTVNYKPYAFSARHDGVNGMPIASPQVIYAPPTSKSETDADSRAFIRGLYHSVLGRDVEGDTPLSYWETVLRTAQAHVTIGLLADLGDPHLRENMDVASGYESDPYLYVAWRFWTSQEHRWRQVESYYHDFLGRDLDPTNARNREERQYWADQFVFGVAGTEAQVIRGFLTSPEYLYDHRADPTLANVLNKDLLGGAATNAHLSDWTSRLSALDARRAALQAQTFATAEDYKAQLGTALASYSDEAGKAGMLFEAPNADEYVQPALDSFYREIVRRAGTAAEKQALLSLRTDVLNNPLSLGSLAEMVLASPEYRSNAVKSEV